MTLDTGNCQNNHYRDSNDNNNNHNNCDTKHHDNNNRKISKNGTTFSHPLRLLIIFLLAIAIAIAPFMFEAFSSVSTLSFSSFSSQTILSLAKRWSSRSSIRRSTTPFTTSTNDDIGDVSAPVSKCSSHFNCFTCLSNNTLALETTGEPQCRWCAFTATCVDFSANCFDQYNKNLETPNNETTSSTNSTDIQQLESIGQVGIQKRHFSVDNSDGSAGNLLDPTAALNQKKALSATASKSKFYNTINVANRKLLKRQSQYLQRCQLEMTQLDQCVVGSQFSKIYLPYSESTRNLQSSGLQKQPILPIASPFFKHYFLPNFVNESSIENDDAGDTEEEVLKKLVVDQLLEYRRSRHQNGTMSLLVGTYLIGDYRKRRVRPYVMFSSVGYEAKMLNYTLVSQYDRKTGQLTGEELQVESQNGRQQKKKKKNDEDFQRKLLTHLLPTNIGLRADRGSYRLGIVVALINSTIDEKSLEFDDDDGENGGDENIEPVCLFFPLPKPISVYPVWRDAVLGIYLYAGVPVFVIGIVLIGLYTVFCPFIDSKKLIQEAYEDNERRELNDMINDSGETINESVLHEKMSSQVTSHDDYGTQLRERVRGVLSFWKYNSDTVITKGGLRGYYYWKFYRRIVLIVLLYATLSLAIILPVNIVFNYRLDLVVDLALTTFGAIRTTSRVSIAHYVIGVLFFLITFTVYIFGIRLTFYKRRYESSVFTARLRHLPVMTLKIERDANGRAHIVNTNDIRAREKLLMQHFNLVLRKEVKREAEKHPDDKALAAMVDTDLVLSVSLIADMAHIMKDIDTQYQLEKIVNDPKSRKEGFIARSRARRLENSRKAMFKKIESHPVTTDQAFVTFKSVYALRRCKVIYKSMVRKKHNKTEFSDEISFSIDAWKLRQVTWEPEDVVWENIYDSTRRNVFSSIAVYVAYFIIYALLIGALLIFFFRYGVYGLFSNLRYRQSFVIMRSAEFLKWLIPVVFGFASSVFSVFLTIAGEISNLIMRAVTGLERMKSKSKASASYLLKSVAIIIPFYLTIPFLGDYLVEGIDPELFYSNSGLALIQFILSYLFFYKGIELLRCVAMVTVNYLLSHGEPERIPFDFNVAYTSALTNFFIIAVTGIRIPLIFIPGVAFFVMTYFVDTFLLLNFYQRSVGTGRIEFALVSVLLLIFGGAAMLSHPSLSALLAFGSVIFVAIALSIISVMVYVYNRRGNKRSIMSIVTDEHAFANKYVQPHLKILMRMDEDRKSGYHSRQNSVEAVELSDVSTPISPVTPSGIEHVHFNSETKLV